MQFVKWVGNSDKNDWTTEEILTDGTSVRLGEPVKLTADQHKEMVGRGRIFEDSSAEEAEQRAEQQFAQQPVGKDVAGTAPVFQNTSSGDNKAADDPDPNVVVSGDKPNDKNKK